MSYVKRATPRTFILGFSMYQHTYERLKTTLSLCYHMTPSGTPEVGPLPYEGQKLHARVSFVREVG